MNKYLRDDLKKVLKDIEYIRKKELEGREIYLDHVLGTLDSAYNSINRALNVQHGEEEGEDRLDLELMGRTHMEEVEDVEDLKEVESIVSLERVGDVEIEESKKTEERKDSLKVSKEFEDGYVTRKEERDIQMSDEVVVEIEEYREAVVEDSEREVIIKEELGEEEVSLYSRLLNKIKEVIAR